MAISQAIPQVEMQAAPQVHAETVEVKQRTQNYEVDESLSEWELARMTSKTWSMEQD